MTWIKITFYLILLLVLARVFFLQVFDRPFLEKKSQSQSKQSSSVKLQRGPILDSSGEILAVSLPMDSIFAIPYEIGDPRQASEIIAPILRQDHQKLYEKFTSNSTFVWIKRNIKPSTSQLIKESKIKGIHRLVEYQRFYPLQSLSAQLVGFSGIDSQGLEGLEYQYNRHLMGKVKSQSIWDAFGNENAVPDFRGGSISLTIWSELQHYVEKELKKAVDLMKAKRGIAIVMETRTGKILSMANLPDYNPNKFSEYDRNRYFNRAIGATYEPGSTFKIITLSAALESKAISKDNIFFCENGEFQIYDRVIHDTEKNGWLTLDKIVQKSSNICAAKIGMMIEKPAFHQTIVDFGFGSKTGVELPGEAVGKVYDYNKWTDLDVATISYGHSISATPLQVVTAINAIATGGVLIEPKVILEKRDSMGNLLELEPPQRKRILSPEVTHLIKGYMVGVTQKGGTGYSARLDGVTVAGKTGTSRKFDSDVGEYSAEKNISSFVGFFPAEDPLLTVLVIIDEPQKTYLGIKGATIVFRKIAKQALRFYPQQGQLGDKQKEIEDSQNAFFEKQENDIPLFNYNKVKYKQIEKLFMHKTMRESLRIASKNKISLVVNGSGRVREVIAVAPFTGKYRLELR